MITSYKYYARSQRINSAHALPGLLKVRFATVRITPEGVNYLTESWKLLSKAALYW
jgi:hypothetical protein